MQIDIKCVRIVKYGKNRAEILQEFHVKEERIMEQYEKIVEDLSKYGECTIADDTNGTLIIRLNLYPNVAVQASDNVSGRSAKQTSANRYVYFIKVSHEDRDRVKEWLKSCKSTSNRVNDFLNIVREATEMIDYEYWIAELEPSVKDGKIYYEEGKDVGVGFSVPQWEKMARRFARERGSSVASLHELFLWYALRIVDGLWTIEFVTRNSTTGGNYFDAPGSSKKIDRSGQKICGGYKDGQGNTCKIVTIEGGYALVGGYYRRCGRDYPVAEVFRYYYPSNLPDDSVAVLVLTR